MDDFSYLSVLISIVLGLGITNLLTGFAAMVRTRGRITVYWPLTVQMCLLFLVHVQLWWALFALRAVTNWSFASFLIVLMQPVLLYLATAFLVPDVAGGEKIDLRQAYFREARWYFAALIASVFVSLAKNLALTGSLQNPTDLAGHAGFLLLATAGVASRSDIVHKMIAPASLALYSAYIAVLFVNLPS